MYKSTNVAYMDKSEKIKTEIQGIEKFSNKENKYEGLILLAGGRLHVGMSLPNVDIVEMFSRISSSDSIYQMLFQGMTELDEEIYCDENFLFARKIWFHG